MNRGPKGSARPGGGGGFFSFLAVILAVATFIGLFASLSSGSTLSRTWSKTEKKLMQREEGFLFLCSALQKGSFSLTDGETALSYEANLPEKASLSLSGAGYDLALFASGSALTAKSESLLPKTLSGDRAFAAVSLSSSAFASEEVKKEYLDLMGLFLALSDPNLPEGNALSGWMKKVAKASSPTLSYSDQILPHGDGIPVTSYYYRISSQGLQEGLLAWKKLGSDPKNADSLCAAISLLRASFGLETSGETLEKIRAFAAGEGDWFQSLSDLAGKENSVLAVDFSVSGGCVIAITADFVLGDFSGKFELFLGQDVENAPEQSLSFTLFQGEEKAVSLSLISRLREDSKKAYIREVEYSLEDETSLLLGDEKALSGKVRFSWGKVKGDLGLRLITAEKEINFRGKVTQWKKGSQIDFEILGLEVNKENILKGKTLLGHVDQKGEPAAPSASQGALFPEGEEKELLREAFLSSYRSLFPKGEAS